MDGFLWKDLARTPNLCHSNENRTYPPPDFSVPLKEWKQIFYDLGSVCNPNEQVYLIKDALEASSKDTVDQDVDKTLIDNSDFWSSLGSESTEITEWVRYKLSQPICLVTAVDISAFNAYFQSGSPIYAPQRIQIIIGNSREPSSDDFESEIFDFDNNDKRQRFTFHQNMILGGYLTIKLIGKRAMQPEDEKYYTVLRHVAIWGTPIGLIQSSKLRKYIFEYVCLKNQSFLKNIGNWYENTLSPNSHNDKDKKFNLFNIDDIDDNNENLSSYDSPNDNPFINGFKESMNQCLKENNITEKAVKCALDLFIYEMRDIEGYGVLRDRKVKRLLQLVTSERWDYAIQFITSQDPLLKMRNEDVLQLILNETGSDGIFSYYISLLQRPGRIMEDESLMLINLTLKDTRFGRLLIGALHKLTCTRKVGDAIKPLGSQLALQIYIAGSCFDAAIELAVEIERFDLIFDIWENITTRESQFFKVINIVKEKHSPLKLFKFCKRIIQQINNISAINALKHSLDIEGNERDILEYLQREIDNLQNEEH